MIHRRAFLIGGATLIGGWRAMPATPACTLTPEQEEGPYYVDYDKLRANITENKVGVPLRLRMALVDAKRCTPLQNAAVDIWHCDAEGVYSGFTSNGNRLGRGPMGGPGFGPPPPGGRPPGPPPQGPPPGARPPHRNIDQTRFLRGTQAVDANGMVEFVTIYPGWYEGRTIHIHMKVHTGGHVSHTGQVFFPEEITERVARLQPYAKHHDVHLTTLAEDHVYQHQHGAGGMAKLERVAAKSELEGFVATVTLAVDPEAVPEPAGMGGPGFPRPPRY